MTDTSRLPKLDVILLSGGSGSRFGGSVPKTFIEVKGRTLILYPLLAFSSMSFVNHIVLVVGQECPLELIKNESVMSGVTIVQGGESRTDSVRNGLETLCRMTDCGEYIAVHDGARPFVPADVIQNVLTAAVRHGIAAPGVPVTDTIKRLNPNNIVSEHLRRDELTAIQTPQIFRRDILEHLYHHHSAKNIVTDDTELAALTGHQTKIVPGSRDMFKITYPEDILLAERVAERYLGKIRRL